MSRFVAPPPHLLMQIANDPSVEHFVDSLGLVRTLAFEYCQKVGYDFQSFRRILDFGCGVGRFLFATDGYLAPFQELLGCDLNAECVDWCNANISFAAIVKASLKPPLPYEDNSIDYINAVSVFTHMTFDVQLQWAREIYRILRPGGIVALTTNGLPHIPFLLSLLGNSFSVADYRSIGSDGLFLSLSAAISDENEGQRAVVTAYSPEALAQTFKPLEVVLYEPLSRLAGGQSIAILRKIRPGNYVQPLTSPSASEFCFPATACPSLFQCYASFADDGHFCMPPGMDYRIALDDDEQIDLRNIDLPYNRIFKTNHMIPLTVRVPCLPRGFTITLGRPPHSPLPTPKFHHPALLLEY